MGEAERQIRELAARHGVTAARQSIDDWCDKLTELSGDDRGQADEIEQLLINLGRLELIEIETALELLMRYMEER